MAADVDEGPQRKVTIAKPFAVGKFEVTFAEWDACVAAGGCKHKPERSWLGERQTAGDQCVLARRHAGIPALAVAQDRQDLSAADRGGMGVRRAGRGTTDTVRDGRRSSPIRRTTTATIPTTGSARYGSAKTVEVGSFAGNAFGLHDMHGNVWEWVQDCFEYSYVGAPADGSAVTSTDCPIRVARGGSWRNVSSYLRSANRGRYLPTEGRNFIGFRVARTLKP